MVKYIMACSEDGASKCSQTIGNIAKQALMHVYPGATVAGASNIEVLPRDDGIQSALSGCNWTSTNPKDRVTIVKLIRTIIDKLLRGNFLIIFHFDGETAWKNRNRDMREKYERIILNDILAFENGVLKEKLSLLVVCQPYYSIESWLFRSRLMSEIDTSYHRGENAAALKRLEAAPSEIDDIERIKNIVTFHNSHNYELSQGFSSRTAFAQSESYKDFVNELRSSTKLNEYFGDPIM